MARAPNEKAAKAEAMYREGMKLVDIAEKLGVPPGTVRRWKSTYQWDGQSKKKQSERSDNESERSESSKKLRKGGQPGNTNALKNATYATEYWKNISEEERAMMEGMPSDEEFLLIETLRLTAVREQRHMGFLARYQELLKNSPDGLVLREDIKTLVKEMSSSGSCIRQTATAQQAKVDAIEQMQIIEAELTRIQKVKIKLIDSLSKVRNSKMQIGNDKDLVDDWIAAVKESAESE